MKTPRYTPFNADQLLRQYAFFEDPAPAPAPDPAPAPTPEEKKFSQADMDKVQGKTRTEAKQAAINDLLKELGFEKPDDLKALVKTVREKDEAEKSELQKALDAKVTLEKEREDAKAALKTFQEQVEAEKRLNKRNAALLKAAATATATVPEDVITWAEKNAEADLAKVLKEDGTVDEEAAKALVAACKAARPNYFGLKSTVPGTGSHRGGTRPDPAREGKEKARQDVKERQRSGW